MSPSNKIMKNWYLADNRYLVFNIDVKGNIVGCNEPFLSSMGFSQSELVGKSVLDVVADESLEDAHELFPTMIDKGGIPKWIGFLQKKTGEKLKVRGQAEAFYDDSRRFIEGVFILESLDPSFGPYREQKGVPQSRGRDHDSAVRYENTLEDKNEGLRKQEQLMPEQISKLQRNNFTYEKDLISLDSQLSSSSSLRVNVPLKFLFDLQSNLASITPYLEFLQKEETVNQTRKERNESLPDGSSERKEATKGVATTLLRMQRLLDHVIDRYYAQQQNSRTSKKETKPTDIPET